MIIWSSLNLKAGERLQGLHDNIERRDYPDVPFVVMREVTVEDWIAYTVQEEGEDEQRCLTFAELYRSVRYYEVSLD